MPLNTTRAADVKAAAAIMWPYIVEFMVANRNDYLGFMATGESHAVEPADDETTAPDLDGYVEDSRASEYTDEVIGQDDDGNDILATRPVRGPTLRDFRAYLIANATTPELATINELMSHARLTRPTVLDKRTRYTPLDLGFYIELRVREAGTAKVWELKKCRCWGSEPWKSETEAANTDMTWHRVVTEESP